MIFLVTEDRTLSYSQLINQINSGTTDNFFSSFIADLASENDIDLSRYTFNKNKLNVSDINDLQNRIINSKSVLSLSTSGTTGYPKIKTHKIKSLLKNTRKMSSNSTWLFTYNNRHMGGVQVLLQAIINLDCIVDVYKKDRNFILKQIDKMKVTHISATPTFYRMLLPFEKVYENVSRVTVGGERSDTKTIKFIKRFFPRAKINNIYATTETGAILFSNSHIFTINKSIVVDGTLRVKLNDGSIHDTGDLVQMISDTEFVFCGRNTNIINIGGNNINPVEIEDIIKSHNKIKNAVVYGKPNKLLGNVLACDVILLDSMTKQELRHYMKSHINNSYKIPRIIHFKDNIKVSNTNKVIR